MKKRIIALTAAMVMLVSLFASCGNAGSAPAKEFSKAGMSISLTETFVEKEMASLTAYYESPKVIVTCLKEEFTQFEALGVSSDDITLDDYAELVIENNQMDLDATKEDGLTYFTYEKTVSGKDFSYMACVYKSSDAFWLIQFACEQKNFDSMKEQMKSWAQTVKFS